MIISASRRTDIPCYYFDWFMKRIKEGFVFVQNPFNAHQIKRVSLLPDDADCFVFWTKNPVPMLERLDELAGIPYYFLFTITSYGKEVEENLPDKMEAIVPAFLKLAEKIGPERVIWRYDPVFLSERYTLTYHLEYFEAIAHQLAGYTKKCVISFLDDYRHTEKRMAGIAAEVWTEKTMHIAAKGLSQIAHAHGMKMDTCAERINLAELGIGHSSCIDAALAAKICGHMVNAEKDRYQRPECGCAVSVDIGAYHTCPNGCRYCYANYSEGTVLKNRVLYDMDSSLLCGREKK